MSPGGVLWSVGSGGEILSQASNYWAEPHSKDMLLIDYTSPTSNKTKVEKPSVCVALSYPSGLCMCVRQENGEGAEGCNTVTLCSGYGAV